MLKLSGRKTAIAGTVLVMVGAIGNTSAVMSASPDLPELGDVPLYRVNVAANGIQPGPGPVGPPQLAWQVDVGDMRMLPILVDGLLIVGTNDGHLVALDARTGATRWDAALGSDPIRPAPASMDGLVYANDTSSVHAVDLSSGSRRWSAPVNSSGARLNAVDGVVYVGVLGGVVGFDARTGTDVWRWEGPAEVPINAGPIADGVGYFTARDGRVFAIDLASKHEVWRLQTISNDIASGQVVGDTFYVSNNQGDAAEPVGEIYAVDRASGDVRWRFRAPSGLQLKEGPVKDGILYASGVQDGIWALRDDGSSVTVMWHVDAPESHWPMSMVGSTLYEVRTDGSVGAYDSADGRLLWETDAVGDWAGGPIVSGGMVFLNNDTEGVMAFADPDLIAQLPTRVAEGSATPGESSATASNPFAFVRAFSWQDTGIGTPLGMAAGPDGLLYVLDTEPQVTVIDPSDGHVVRRWGRQGAGPGEFDVSRSDNNPGYGDVAVAQDGRVYVADGSNHRVQVFQPDGTFLFQFGSFGTGDGQFGSISELDIGPDGSVYVKDGPISKFTPDGKFVWRSPNTEHAYGLAVRADGLILASCEGCGQTLLFSPQDGHIAGRMHIPEMGETSGEIHLDPDGNMYLVLYGGAPLVQGKDVSDALLVFDRDGTYLGGRYIEPEMQGTRIERTIAYNDAYWPSPIFLPDGRAFTFGQAGIVELRVTLPAASD